MEVDGELVAQLSGAWYMGQRGRTYEKMRHLMRQDGREMEGLFLCRLGPGEVAGRW